MSVSFIDLKRFEDGFLAAWSEKVASMSAKAQFIGGSEVERLEARLKEAVEVSCAVTCANGTDALQLALRAVGVGKGDSVLVPNLTFWATFEAVINVGAAPVTVDIDMFDGGVDESAFRDAVGRFKPKAALIAHLYGWGTARLQNLRDFCRDNGVTLIEDGAQSFGTRFNGASIYRGAAISTTSFYPAKVLGAAGDGGAVFTDDEVVAKRVRDLANHGRATHYGHGAVGWNSRLDALQAAYLNLCLDHLPDRLESRRKAAAAYGGVLSKLDAINHLTPPAVYVQNGYCNVCLVPDPKLKSALEAAFKANEIGFGNIYPGAMSDQPGAAAHLLGHVGSDNARRFCKSVFNLPLFPYMRDSELADVSSVLTGVMEASVL